MRCSFIRISVTAQNLVLWDSYALLRAGFAAITDIRSDDVVKSIKNTCNCLFDSQPPITN